MDFALTDNQEAIRDAIAKICSPFDDAYWLRKDREGGFPHDFHKALADAGVFGLAIAEQYGGSGGSLDDLAVFYTEAGRALCPTTVHSTVLTALAIDQLGPPAAKAAWLPALASGSAMMGGPRT